MRSGKILTTVIYRHHQKLLDTALGISRAVSTAPQLVGPGQLADVLVDHYVLNGLQELNEKLAEPEIDAMSDGLGRPWSDDWDLQNGMAEKLLKEIDSENVLVRRKMLMLPGAHGRTSP